MAPKGWTGKIPPEQVGDYIWLSPQFGVDKNGENLLVSSHHVSAATTLDQEVHRAIDDVSQDRIIANSHSDPTCHGLQAGWAFEANLPLPNGQVVSQVYHITIVDGRAYAFIFTHLAGARVDQAIGDSIQSICSSNRTL